MCLQARRETVEISKVGRALLQGRDARRRRSRPKARCCSAPGDLLALDHVVVINDERRITATANGRRETTREDLRARKKRRGQKTTKAAVSGYPASRRMKRKVGVRAVYDLRQRPSSCAGSGYREGLLFPWTISDFSLMDAIECGIVVAARAEGR